MDEKKFEEGINCFAHLLGSFLELRKMGYTQEEINWAYNTMSGNFVPNFNIKNLSNLIESRKENWKVIKKHFKWSVLTTNLYIFRRIHFNIKTQKTQYVGRGKKWNIL